MPGVNEDKDRQVVPRWRLYRASSKHGELAPLKSYDQPRYNDELLAKEVFEFNQTQSPAIAAELLSLAVAFGLENVAKDAAELLLKRQDTPPLAREMAERYLHPHIGINDHENLINRQQQIAAVRKQLRAYPRDPILWTNYSWLLTTIGKPHEAERAMLCAMQLAPNNRLVLRAASRLHVHNSDLEKAHAILETSIVVLADPWVMAAEVAIAGARSKISKHIKRGVKALESGNFSPRHISELASAISTMELKSGNRKQGKKLIRQSLESPTENTVAQTNWLLRNSFVSTDVVANERLDLSNESNAWTSYNAEKIGESLNEAERWLNDQPFSSRPASFGSYLACMITDDLKLSHKFIDQGLLCSPDDPTLLNNSAFTFIMENNLEKAAARLNSCRHTLPDEGQKIALVATTGLLMFRSGKPEIGRRLYQKAIDLAEKNDPDRFAVAKIMLALEESRIDPNAGKRFRQEARAAIQKSSDIGVHLVGRKLDSFKDDSATQ